MGPREYFTLAEFECPCRRPQCVRFDMNGAFLGKLNRMRDMFGKPIRIESGFRCKEHNADIKGKPDSLHLVGRAADLIVESDADRYQLLRIAFSIFAGVGINKNTIHVDDRNPAK